MQLDKQTFQRLLLLVAFGVGLYWGLQNLDDLGAFLGVLLGLVMPFLIGGCVAFILTVPMRALERALFARYEKSKSRPGRIAYKLRRPLSLVLTILLVLGVIAVVLFLILPEVGRSLGMLAANIPPFIERATQLLQQYSDQVPLISSWLSSLELDWSGIVKSTWDFLQNGAGTLLGSVMGAAMSILGGLLTAVLAAVFSVYLLLQKEKLGGQGRKLLYGFLPEGGAGQTLSIAALSSRTFASFLSGQCLEAVILGCLFFIAMSVLRFPYALMISVLVGFTALIPLFGAFIGCAVGAFMILIIDPMRALWFVILFLVLQQIEGNLIYPKVVGGSVGLPSIWVLVAVTIGGSTMGIAGMLLFIPLCSVLYALLRRTVYERLQKKEVPPGEWESPPGGGTK